MGHSVDGKEDVLMDEIVESKYLTLKAKAVYWYLWSRPDEWEWSLKRICNDLNVGETAITRAINELQNEGYLEIKRLYPNETASGRIEYMRTIYKFKKRTNFHDSRRFN